MSPPLEIFFSAFGTVGIILIARDLLRDLWALRSKPADARRDEYRVGTTLSRDRVLELAAEHGVTGLDVDGFFRACAAEALKGRPREDQRA